MFGISTNSMSNFVQPWTNEASTDMLSDNSDNCIYGAAVAVAAPLLPHLITAFLDRVILPIVNSSTLVDHCRMCFRPNSARAETVVQNQSKLSEEATSELLDWLDSKSSWEISTLHGDDLNHLQGLLDAGADVNVDCGWYRETLAQSFACNGNLEGLRLIAGYGADFNKVARNTYSPAWLAANTHHYEALALLKTFGVDTDELATKTLISYEEEKGAA